MDWTYNAKIAAVKLKHLSGLLLLVGGREFVTMQLLPRIFRLWEEEDFCEWYILVEGDWELLSGGLLVILLKITQYEASSEVESSCFRK